MSDTRIATNVAAARTDDELRSLLLEGKDKTVQALSCFIRPVSDDKLQKSCRLLGPLLRR